MDAYRYKRRDAGEVQDQMTHPSQTRAQSHTDDRTPTRRMGSGSETQIPMLDQGQMQGYQARGWIIDCSKRKTVDNTHEDDETRGWTIHRTHSNVDTRSQADDNSRMQGQTSDQEQSIATQSLHQSSVERQIRMEESLESIEDLKENDVVIAVMGPTGSGKSTLVRSITGCETAGVGNGLKSFTSDVRAIRFRDEESGQFVVLVDTPGFDDTYKSDLDILNMISDWLSLSYKKHKLLSGILYLHRITDNRVAGTSLKNLRVFRKLCGDDALKRVYLTTTMWDEVMEEVGRMRLEELKSEYWKAMINHGAQVFCCGKIDGSPKELARRIVADEDCRRLLLQKEIVELQKEIKETAAGQELYSHLEAIVQKQTEVIQRLNEARVRATNPQLVSELERQLSELRKQVDERLLDIERMKLPRMKRFFTKIRDASGRMIRALYLKFLLLS